MKPFILILILAVAGTVVIAQPTKQPLPEVSTTTPSTDRYPKHQPQFADGVKGVPDLVYSTIPGYRPLTLDLYLPGASLKRPSAGFPLVVQIHGGGWLAGNKRSIRPFVDWPGVLASLAAKGYVVASINYRLSGEAGFPAQIQDVKAALRWLRSNAATYGIDPARVATWGPSAGGHLASLAGVSCGATALEPKGAAPTTKGSECVQAFVSWFGVFDFATFQAQARETSTMSRETRDAPEWRLLGCFANECKSEQLAAASPSFYLDATDPPMLLIVGDNDTVVPTKQTLEMADKAKQAGIKYELMVLPGVNHSFIGKSETETREANLKALAATFDFFDRTIGGSEANAGTGREVLAIVKKIEPKAYTDHLENGRVLVSDVIRFEVVEPTELKDVTVMAYYQGAPNVQGRILKVGDQVRFELPSGPQRHGILLQDLKRLRLRE